MLLISERTLTNIMSVMRAAGIAAVLSVGTGQALGYAVDTKIGEALLANSGNATELAGLAAILGVNANTLVLDYKINTPTPSTVAFANPGGGWFIDVGTTAPGYFMLKFGIGGTSATADHFYFQNVDDLTKLVWTDDQVQFLSGGACRLGNQNACNIDRLSHYSGFDGTGRSVPEPASLALVGLGLLAAATVRRRKS